MCGVHLKRAFSNILARLIPGKEAPSRVSFQIKSQLPLVSPVPSQPPPSLRGPLPPLFPTPKYEDPPELAILYYYSRPRRSDTHPLASTRSIVYIVLKVL